MGLTPGAILGHYRIGTPLGAGGMGEVYQAEDTRLKRMVALKVLSRDVASDPGRLERFEREAQAVAALNHPNIVTIHSVEEAHGRHFLTMELVEGHTLDHEIPDGGLPLPEFFRLAVPLVDAVSTAHEKGITHRDLKPANVMITGEHRVKVLDFGLAKLRGPADALELTRAPTEAMTQEGVIVGTVPYMSPEQLQARPVDHRSDIFSVGILLHQMATGERPFSGSSSAEVMSSILRDLPAAVHEIHSRLPHQLGRIIRRCLEKDPERRYQSAKDLRNELEDLHREITTEPGRTAGAPAPLPSRRSALAGWLAGVAGGVVLVAALVLWLRPTAEESRAPTEPAAAPAAAATGPARKMLVVFPFENLGAADDTYFASGVTEEITSRLAAVHALGVISRTTAIQYDPTGKTMRQIGQDLGVDYVLEGTVRWNHPTGGPSRVRVIPQLIRVEDDTHVWSERYEEELEDIFEMETAIAEKVIAELNVTLLKPEEEIIEAEPTQNLEAYQAFLKGLDIEHRAAFDREEYIRSIRMLERAVELDPSFALAWAALARVHAYLNIQGLDRSPERQEMAKAALDRALELDPDLPEVQIAVGYYYYHGLRDYDHALEALSLASKQRPNDSELLAAIGFIRRRQGRWDEALSYLERARRLSPRDAQLAREMGITCVPMRRHENANGYFDQAIALDPGSTWARDSKILNQWLGWGERERVAAFVPETDSARDPYSLFIRYFHHFLSRDFGAALAVLGGDPAAVLELPAEWIPKAALRGAVLLRMGKESDARAEFEVARGLLEAQVRSQPDDHRPRSALGVVYACLGRRDDALREANLAVELYPVSKDAFLGTIQLVNLAHVHTILGDADAAAEQLRELLRIESWVTVPLLRADPRWDPLRDHPGFQAMIEE
jgi:TolB-like protein/Flp pilus assembly protein TadD